MRAAALRRISSLAPLRAKRCDPPRPVARATHRASRRRRRRRVLWVWVRTCDARAQRRGPCDARAAERLALTPCTLLHHPMPEAATECGRQRQRNAPENASGRLWFAANQRRRSPRLWQPLCHHRAGCLRGPDATTRQLMVKTDPDTRTCAERTLGCAPGAVETQHTHSRCPGRNKLSRGQAEDLTIHCRSAHRVVRGLSWSHPPAGWRALRARVYRTDATGNSPTRNVVAHAVTERNMNP